MRHFSIPSARPLHAEALLDRTIPAPVGGVPIPNVLHQADDRRYGSDAGPLVAIPRDQARVAGAQQRWQRAAFSIHERRNRIALSAISRIDEKPVRRGFLPRRALCSRTARSGRRKDREATVTRSSVSAADA